MKAASAERDDVFPASAQAVTTLDEASAGDLETIASTLDRVAALSEQLADVLRIRKDTSTALSGMAELARTKAKEVRREATDFRAWLTGKTQVPVKVTVASDGNGASVIPLDSVRVG